MGFFSRLFRQQATKSNATLELFRDLFGRLATASGRSVTTTSALEVSTVLACAGVIADGVSTVPLKMHRKLAAGGREDLPGHPLDLLFGVAPNEWQDSLQYRETMAFHLVLCGNAFSFKNVVGGRVVELIPLEPGRVTVKRGADLSLSYEVADDNGQRRVFPAEAIWHMRGPSWNSWMGLETVRLAREAIGLALATEETHARLHANGARVSGTYSVEGTLRPEQYKDLRAWIEQMHVGGENAWRPMILDRNAKFTPTSMTGVDAQHLETRRYQVEEICRALRVLPIMVGYSQNNTSYASVEQMFLAHAVHTIRPWHRRFEASIRQNLLTEEDRAAGVYAKFHDAELLRGAAKDRSEFYARALGAGGSPAWLEINEVRGFEDLPPVPWGEGQPKTAAPVAPQPGGRGTIDASDTPDAGGGDDQP